MLAQGATALAESWNFQLGESHNHAMFGHIEEWFYEYVGGIQFSLTNIHFPPLPPPPMRAQFFILFPPLSLIFFSFFFALLLCVPLDILRYRNQTYTAARFTICKLDLQFHFWPNRKFVVQRSSHIAIRTFCKMPYQHACNSHYSLFGW